METITYKVETFEGPLDLLLNLIMKNKMDICDIEISVIFDQYTAYLEKMKQMNMEIAGDFIVMASELMFIKSRMLLPKVEEEEEDPRERLAQALLEYKRAKEAAVYLEEQYRIYGRRMVKETDEIPTDNNRVSNQNIKYLEEAVRRLMVKKEREKVPPIAAINPIIQKIIVPVSEKIRYVLSRLSSSRRVNFDDLFDEAQNKSEVVAIFIAVLALIKDGHIALEKELCLVDTPNNETENNDIDYEYRFSCTLVGNGEINQDAYAEFDA